MFFFLLSLLATTTQAQQQLEVVLKSGQRLPLVGLGVGNLAHDRIRWVVGHGVRELGVRVIDTAMASRNEHLIAGAIIEGRDEVLVVTKVWYTHLGYNRTRLAVADAVAGFSEGSRLVVLIHWPRCREDIPWMRCDEEEAELEERVKRAGPPPDPETAWRGSWRALEDAYDAGLVAAIGVSNFDVRDTRDLLGFARVVPHLAQINLWTYLFDPELVELLEKNEVAIQAYNAMNGVVARRRYAPRAYADLERLGTTTAVGTLVLAALAQRGVAVVPRASTVTHLAENSPAAVAAVPPLDAPTRDRIDEAMRALMTGNDFLQVEATFVNRLDETVGLFWVHAGDEEVAADLPAGDAATLRTYEGHEFVARVRGQKEVGRFRITTTTTHNHILLFDITRKTAAEL
ncbi:hypothetical protein CTAYLR_009033 [Chrysophaeum taylorii]|uniref:NADP-dependent oxidoreductase domain-containing protein n=1 Tax=Chrysophaeum taylorii TaxID=2483200 RepID=A0AAD7UGD9_9STRA|nr:hypothetical protein CTAYLR_009033 [Chrysophaeum taylorii]